jgi:transketolase
MRLNDHPSIIVLTRQNLPTLCRDKFAPASGALRGGYVLAEAGNGKPQVILIGTGSEISLCTSARDVLEAEGIATRVVSMPCFELFDEQDQAYRDSVLPSAVTARVGVEAGIRQGWDKYIGCAGRFVGIEHFGASAPAAKVFAEFGITADHIAAEARSAIK